MTTFYFNNKDMNQEFTFLEEEEQQQQEVPWLPLSPPLTKKEQPPVSATNHSGVNTTTWHSLWSSSTWQEPVHAHQKRTRSLSLVPPTAAESPLPPSSFQSTGFMINQPTTDKSIWSFNYFPEERRHSIAYFNRPITPPPQESVQQLIQQLQQRQQQQINEYFSPTTTATVDVQYLGKGISMDQIRSDQPIYEIQFKENYRTDYFYIQQQELLDVHVNDMVIVEADRGYDLGKVISILHDCKSTTHMAGGSVVKRIFRHANPAELSTHALKKQDEEKALIICQAKIKQKNLNMQVIDAEYQWDRRKLTFYFKANERIDFRELVRELFKIYKTRIWMCATSDLE